MMKTILLCIILITIVLGGFFGLWKLEKWLRPIETGELESDAKKSKNPLHEIRKRMIIMQLVTIWITIFPVGFFGVWKKITAPLLLILTILITTACVISIIKERHCNICLGCSDIYWALLCLLAVYKLGYWQFKMSYWWLIGGILAFIVGSLLSLWLFAKSGYKVHKKGEGKYQFSAIGIAFAAYPIAKAIGRFAKQNHMGNDVAVPIVMIGLLLISWPSLLGIRYILLDDSKLLRNNPPDCPLSGDQKSV